MSHLHRKYFCIISILIVIFFNVVKDKSYYHDQPYDEKYYYDQPYDPKPGQDVYYRVKKKSEPVPIVLNLDYRHINCYEPIFGYKHEFFPQKNLLRKGSIFLEKDNYFNMKNPACYVFSEENACKPGDHFKVEQKTELKKFVNYKPYRFKLSETQIIANEISFISAILSLVYAFIFFVLHIYARQRRGLS